MHPPKILIRADADANSGTGHLMRCLAVAEAVVEKGTLPILLYHHAPASILERFSELGVSIVELHTTPHGLEDAQACDEVCQKEKCPWILVDGYLFDKPFFETLQNRKTKTIVIDDFARPPVLLADLIVNPSPKATAGWYQDHPSLLLGLSFIPLRAEFRNQSHSFSSHHTQILITTGGGDDLNITPVIIRTLLSHLSPLITLKVIIGAANPHRDLLFENFANTPYLSLIENISHMAAEISQSNLVITGAGSTVWECLALGRPLLTMILADNQIDNERYFSRQDFALSAGDARKDEFPTRLLLEFQRFLKSPQTIQEKVTNFRPLIDSRGAFRIVEALNPR